MICPLCERDCPDARMQRHHLQTRRKDRFDVERICSDCHRAVHAFFSNDELRKADLQLDTVEGLLANEAFSRHVAFVRTLPAHRRVRMARRRHRRR